MSVDREELKQLIDLINEEDAAEVYDFIGYLNMKREKEVIENLDVERIAQDPELIRQIEGSQKDRLNGRVFNREQGLKYLRDKKA
ncbi:MULTISPECIES: hypothetical protein [unclassified Sporosarcina]|uniref:hypothetical protein n=1 Tax=unclassified Sporosarcina TaxID=2647733 RepID=UPI00203DAB90|nr:MULTISPECIES: hypothetical protein [unclassified Sporosarcina]GKV65187.1 hypothetical protein NCCP2331_13400 [Sporosarcina sp. NCCP-2331]GLB55311.1 hypothetical protein NCCP2378_10970 [Sporosarcina sp. NCCP-2378]